MYKKMSRTELAELIHRANSERSRKAAVTRRGRQELRSLYALTDPRVTEPYSPDDPVAFLEQLYGLEDNRA